LSDFFAISPGRRAAPEPRGRDVLHQPILVATAHAVKANALLILRGAGADDPSERLHHMTVGKGQLDAHVKAQRQLPGVGDAHAAAGDVERGGLAADVLVDPAHAHREVRGDADELAPLDALDVAAQRDGERARVLRRQHAAEAMDAAAGHHLDGELMPDQALDAIVEHRQRDGDARGVTAVDRRGQRPDVDVADDDLQARDERRDGGFGH
jgi:hypothetical protein